MYDGVKAMIEAEKKLAQGGNSTQQDKAHSNGAASCKAGSHIQKPEDITGKPEFSDNCKSLLKQHLTNEVWEKYKDAKDKYEFSFLDAILSGV